MKRVARTRSENRASQPSDGHECAQCSVGYIDADGIRYGFTTHALIANTLPMMSLRGTEPQRRESHDSPRLSPMKKYSPFGTCQVPVVESWARRSGLMYGSSSFLSLMYIQPPVFSVTVSPGSPIRRLTKVPL